MKRKTIAALLLLLLLTVVPAVGSRGADADADNTLTVTDDLGRAVTLHRPERVACLMGSFADIWYTAGGADTLVAAAEDSWSSYELPLDRAAVQNLGESMAPNGEALLAALPDLVIGSKNVSADTALLPALEAADIPALYFDVANFADYLRVLKVFTELTGCPENYDLYGTAVQAAAESAIARRTAPAPRVLCLRVSSTSVKTRGSEGNIPGEILRDLGAVNIADGNTALSDNLSMEAILLADPDYIFAVPHGGDSEQALACLRSTLLNQPAWQELTAVQQGHFAVLDPRLFNVKPNARWGEAYEILTEILYPVP